MSKLSAPEIINGQHEVESFDCDSEPLNNFIKKYALINIQNNSARTYVTCLENKVLAYYTLCYGSVTHEAVPKRVSKGLAKHQIPVMVLARLAVDKSQKGMGLGKGLLKDAILRTINAAEIAGLRAILVHAKDQKARDFYMKFGFEPSPIDELHLFSLVKDIIKSLES